MRPALSFHRVSFLIGALAFSSLAPADEGSPATGEKPRESLPPGPELVGLEVFPEKVELQGPYAYRQVIVTGLLSGEKRADVTRLVEIDAPPGIVEVSPTGLVRAASDGSGEIGFELGGRRVTVPVTVSGQSEKFRPSFVQDVMPVMSRLGCNGGTCHGSASGKNGFKLSLRGYDPLFDHRALIDDLSGRRFNRAAPERSLFLMKLSGALPHVGGVLAEPGEPYYETFKAWVADGVRLDLESPRVERIEVFPKKPVVPLPGMRQQMAVIATYTDGRVRDVTREAFLEASNTEVSAVDRPGIVTAIRRGETAVLARYEGRYDATQLFVMGDRSGWEWKDVPEYNKIDTLVYQKLRKIKSLPSEVCTDAEFLRRVYLDLTGLPPTPKEVRTFLLDRRDSRRKREELVDRLIGSAEFVDHWTNKWSDLLQVNPKFLGEQGVEALRGWIRSAVASNMPYDRFVHEILTAEGSTLENPPAAYYKVLREPEEVMENTTQLFLGIRFNCNKCHDHPFERWTQENYWELSAFFARVGRKDAPGSRKMPRISATQGNPPAFEEIIFDKEEGEVDSPYGPKPPAFPYRHAGDVASEATRRAQLASWITAEENPYFARSFVNRLWSYLLGVGLIEPVDDIRAGNPPTIPALLDYLTEEFLSNGSDARHILRLICTSRVYQHSIRANEWNEDDDLNYSHALARRLPAETLYDAIHRATGSRMELPGLRSGTRAAEADPSVKLGDGFLDLFGRPPRESACECERSSGMSLGQALNLVNGPTVAEAINDPENAIAETVRIEKDPEKIVEEIYLAVLCRMPTDLERKELVKTFDVRNLATTETLSPENLEELEKRLASWEKGQSIATWTPLEIGFARSSSGATFERQDDGSVLADGESPDKDNYTVIAHTGLTKITGLRLEVLPHESLGGKGPGRADNGNFVLSEIRVAAAPVSDPSAAKKIELQHATADHSQNGFGVDLAIDGKGEKGWAVGNEFAKPHEAVFETKEDIGAEGGTLLTFTLEQQHGGKHTIGRFRLWASTSPRPVRYTTLPEDVIEALLTPTEKRTPEQRAAIFRQYIRGDQDMQDRLRLNAAQDLAWALINSPAFLFNR